MAQMQIFDAGINFSYDLTKLALLLSGQKETTTQRCAHLHPHNCKCSTECRGSRSCGQGVDLLRHLCIYGRHFGKGHQREGRNSSCLAAQKGISALTPQVGAQAAAPALGLRCIHGIRLLGIALFHTLWQQMLHLAQRTTATKSLCKSVPGTYLSSITLLTWSTLMLQFHNMQVIHEVLQCICTHSKSSVNHCRTDRKKMEVLRMGPDFGHGLHLLIIIQRVIRSTMAAATCTLHLLPFR